MQIYLKIGTMPALVYHVCRKRKMPAVGDLIHVKKDNKSWVKSERVLIDAIKNIHGRTLFIAARL